MKAVRLNQWGQSLAVEDLSQPTPTNEEVLVHVHAASLNPVDSFVIAGYLQSMLQVPLTPGTDFAGEVVAVGADVTHVKPGDAVYGMIPLRGGAFAEYAVAKGNEVALKPLTLDYIEAAAVPLAAIAAWQSLFDLAQVQSGERVLIHGAGGSVGSLAVQLARHKGAYVIASDHSGKKAFLRELGIDQIIDAQVQRFEDVVGQVDIVLNFASDDLVERSYSVLKPGGRYVTTLQQPDQDEAERRGVRSLAVFAQPTPDHLSQIAGLIDAGKVKVSVQRTFPLLEAQAALDFRQTATTPGKVVLIVG
ncbi:MAG: NADP-dependent oxidoreductase [Chloroflexi bacterium]|nr:NADP-dependent oxidoreductase [Chloroflexota bacterium]